MFNQVRQFLIQDYTNQVAQYDLLKNELEELEQEIKNDTSEKEYVEKEKAIKKKYNIFKRGKKYKKELQDLMVDYDKKLKEFKKKYDQYLEIRSKASKINIYALQKKIEHINNAKSLEDLKMTEEEANKLISSRKN